MLEKKVFVLYFPLFLNAIFKLLYMVYFLLFIMFHF